MTIPHIQGAGEAVTDSLASLVDSVGSLLRPTAKYDQALKQIFLTKPELMQKLVDVEKENPGTLKAFGFGEGATNFVSGMKESIPSIREQLGRDALEDPQTARVAGSQEATGLTPSQQMGEKLHEYMLGGGLDLVKKDPVAFENGVRKILQIPSKEEQQITHDTMVAYNRGMELSQKSIPQIVDGIIAGTVTNEQLSGGLIHPSAVAGVKAALAQYQRDRDQKALQEIARTRTAGVGSRALEVAMYKSAYDQFKASKGVAPLGAFFEYMNGVPYHDTPASTEDLSKVKTFLESVQASADVQRRSDLMKSIAPLYNSIMAPKKGTKAPTKDAAQNSILQINQLLEAAGTEWRAELDWEHNWLSPNKALIAFRDKTGHITKDPIALFSQVPGADTAKVTDLIKMGQGPVLSAEQQRMIAYLRGMADDERRDSIVQSYYKQEKDAGGSGELMDAVMDSVGAH